MKTSVKTIHTATETELTIFMKWVSNQISATDKAVVAAIVRNKCNLSNHVVAAMARRLQCQREQVIVLLRRAKQKVMDLFHQWAVGSRRALAYVQIVERDGDVVWYGQRLGAA